MDNTKESGNINLKAFSNDVLIFSFGQAVLLIFGIVQTLIIPKYLSTTDYGYWQLFILYTTFVGILHIGFLNGILIKWAGKDIEDLEEEIPSAFKFILIEQGIVVGVLVLILWLSDMPSKEIGLSVLINAAIVNFFGFFTIIAMSTKRFRLLTIVNIGKGLIFFIFVLIIMVCGYYNYIFLIIAMMVSSIITIFFFIHYFYDFVFHHPKNKKSLFQYGKENIGIGFFVLLSSFVTLIFTSIDRLIVGYFFPINEFAIYAFAITMCAIVTIFLLAVAQVFFPYLSGSSSEIRIKAYSRLKPTIVIFWAVMLAFYFPCSFGIRYYLPNYADSLPLMAILFCTIGFNAQIQIMHANFFNVYQKQRKYFIIAGISLLGAVILNLLAVKIFGTLIAVAITAIISFSVWYLLNEITLRHLLAAPFREIIRWVLVAFAYIGAFLGAYVFADTWIIGFGIYLTFLVAITTACLRNEIMQLWNIFKGLNLRRKIFNRQ